MQRRMADAEALQRIGIPARSRGRRWLGVLVVIAVIGALVAGGIVWARNRGPSGPLYETARIERGELTATVTATGTLGATNTVQVGAEVSGRVVRVAVGPNDTVRVGDVLVELDQDLLEAQVREARANVSAAQAAVRVARSAEAESTRNAARAEALAERDLVPTADVEQARSVRERARAEVASATARLEIARAALTRATDSVGRAVIRSPIDGVVLTRTVEPGQAIASQFQTPVLFEVAEDLSRMHLRVDVDEADVGQVRDGQRATFTVDAYPTRTFEATIRRVDLAPRTVQGVVTYEALLDVDNSERALRPGMTATATIVTDRHEGVLLVPDPAMRFAPPQESRFGPPRGAPEVEGPAVWTDENGVATPHAVRVIASDGTRTAIEGDVAAEGREVITGLRETPR